MKTDLKGIYGILVTPFDMDGSIDLDSLRREARFCLSAGAHGLVWPVSSSEFQALSLDERRRGVEAIAHEVSMVPEMRRPGFVAGVAALNWRDAVELSAHAESAGADAVIAMPPFATPNIAASETLSYYGRIAGATSLPVVVQNQGGPMGNTMTADFIVKMARDAANIRYVKEESAICTHALSALLKHGVGVLSGVFGGSAGLHLVQEMIRGSCGMMSSCHLVDLQVRVWDLFHHGDVQGARDMLSKTLPVQVLWQQLGMRIPKEVLKERGVIKHSMTRRGDNLDEWDLKELRALIESLRPLFTA